MHRAIFTDACRGIAAFSASPIPPTHSSTPWGALQTSLRFASSTPTPAVNHYKRLGVDTTATVEDIKTAYRCRALQCHPDVVDNTHKAQAEVEFRAVSEAYDVLMDPQRRAEHDKVLGVQHTSPAQRTCEKASPSASTRGTTTPTTTTTNRPRGRKTFVRGDADRKFREAFHGMSLDQVIFQERRRQRQMQQEENSNKTATTSSASPLGHEESLRRVMADAAARFAATVQRQYGPSMLRHVKVCTAPSFSDQTPPSDYMPFRPFHGFSAPPGVRTPPEPKLVPTSDVNGESDVKFAEPSGRVRRELPKSIPVVRTLDGSVMGRSEAERYLDRERNSPCNMGKMYSYHRPY